MYRSQLDSPYNDDRLDPTASIRSLQALAMYNLKMIASWYQNGTYYFQYIDGEIWEAQAIVAELHKIQVKDELWFLIGYLEALIQIAYSREDGKARPTRPVIDPIYFGC